MNHELYETGDFGVPDSILDGNGEVALGLCKVCNGAEASLPTQCPGRQITSDESDRIQAGGLDWIRGRWVTVSAPA